MATAKKLWTTLLSHTKHEIFWQCSLPGNNYEYHEFLSCTQFFSKITAKKEIDIRGVRVLYKVTKTFPFYDIWLRINIFLKNRYKLATKNFKIQVTPTIFLEKIVIHTNKYVCFFPLRLRCSNKPIFLVKQIHSLYPCLLMQHKT